MFFIQNLYNSQLPILTDAIMLALCKINLQHHFHHGLKVHVSDSVLIFGRKGDHLLTVLSSIYRCACVSHGMIQNVLLNKPNYLNFSKNI